MFELLVYYPKIILFLWVVIACIFGVIADYKGYTWWVWGLVTLLLPFAGMLAVIALPYNASNKKQVDLLTDILYYLKQLK